MAAGAGRWPSSWPGAARSPACHWIGGFTKRGIFARRDPTLLADPSKGNEGILDDEDPERFLALEAEAAEEVILAEDVGEEEGGEVPSQ
jgi:hypothetical protein